MTTSPTGPSVRLSVTSAERRRRVLVTAVVGVVTAVISALIVGPTGLWGGLAGIVLVLLFFGTSGAVFRRTQAIDPAVLMGIALGLYLAKVLLLVLSLVLLSVLGLLDDPLHRGAVAAAVAAGTLTWITTEVVGTLRGRQPIYDEPQEQP